ncbi:MAG: thiolase family protein [Candidatus Latescibacter sp.]|nr:thiolase family protein [Candidatus Latescibacter sp.]
MRRCVVIGAKRSPVGRFGGSLKDIPAVDLATQVITSLLGNSPVSPEMVDNLVVGEIIQTDPGGNVARWISLKCGMRTDAAPFTVNINCGSGLKAIELGVDEIRLGKADIVIAGGVEVMSRAPFLLNSARWEGLRYWDKPLVDMLSSCVLAGMGLTAENIAERYHVSREDQDMYAYESHMKAAWAEMAGVFANELVPIQVPQKKGEPVIFDCDESFRADTTVEKLSKLKPTFKENGTVTAGNASSLNDAAAFLLLAEESKARAIGAEILASVEDFAGVGVDPDYMGMGPVDAIRKLLAGQKLALSDIDLFEINEAFASQVIAVLRELGLDRAKNVNIYGSGISLGHPIGATGARITVTLLHEMKRRNARYGISSLCIGGGQGIAGLFKRGA